MTVAGAEPDRAAKNMEARTVTWPRPPLKPRTRLLERLMSFSERPPNFMRLPASIKKGMAMRGKESRPRKQYWGMVMTSRLVVSTMVTRVERPREIPTGTLAIIRPIKRIKSRATPDMINRPPFLSYSSGWRSRRFAADGTPSGCSPPARRRKRSTWGCAWRWRSGRRPGRC